MPQEWKIDTELGEGGKYTQLAEGYVIWSRLTVSGRKDALRVTVDVEIEDGHAIARRVEVSTDEPGGVSSTLLRDVPVRGVMGWGVLGRLARVEITGKDATMVALGRKPTDADLAVVKRLVGYVSVRP
jgi:hypothetical protein